MSLALSEGAAKHTAVQVHRAAAEEPRSRRLPVRLLWVMACGQACWMMSSRCLTQSWACRERYKCLWNKWRCEWMNKQFRLTVSYNSGYYSFMHRLLFFICESEPGITVPSLTVQWGDGRETRTKSAPRQKEEGHETGHPMDKGNSSPAAIRCPFANKAVVWEL